MAEVRYLIVNADDFGQTEGVNRGVIAAHERGIVTSASLMVRWPAAVEAAAYARAHPALGLGLHLDLGEWAVDDGNWFPVYEVVPLTEKDVVTAAVEDQLNRFIDLVGRPPTHLDSHQHVHRQEPVHSAMRLASRRLKVPLRHFDAGVHFCGSFYGQTKDGLPHPEGISLMGLLNILKCLGPGITELACHPGLDDDTDSMYCTQRAIEVGTLCDYNVLQAIQNAAISLCHFGTRPDHYMS